MGCDIHAWAEVRKDGAWTLVIDRRFPDPYWKEGDPIIDQSYGDGSSYYSGPTTAHPYEGRNYELFAILAGVRNYDDVEPIAEPRGVPEDASTGYAKEVADWGADGHSHTWFTLSELLALPWESRKIERSGVMTEGNYVRLLRTGEWDSCARSVSGRNIVTLSPEAYEEMLGVGGHRLLVEGETNRDPTKRYFINARWQETYAQVAAYFHAKTLPELRRLADDKGVSHDDVRLVMFFDN